MYCPNCGNKLEDSPKFCCKCGAKLLEIGNAEQITIKDEISYAQNERESFKEYVDIHMDRNPMTIDEIDEEIQNYRRERRA